MAPPSLRAKTDHVPTIHFRHVLQVTPALREELEKAVVQAYRQTHPEPIAASESTLRLVILEAVVNIHRADGSSFGGLMRYEFEVETLEALRDLQEEV